MDYGLCLKSRFRYIFRNFPAPEMPAIQFSNCGNKNYSWRAHVRVGEAEGDPEGDGRRTLANGWESRLWRLEDKHLR